MITESTLNGRVAAVRTAPEPPSSSAKSAGSAGLVASPLRRLGFRMSLKMSLMVMGLGTTGSAIAEWLRRRVVIERGRVPEGSSTFVMIDAASPEGIDPANFLQLVQGRRGVSGAG